MLKLVLSQLRAQYAADPLPKARLLLEEAKQARLAGDHPAAIKFLIEASKVLDAEKSDEARAELAIVSAWRAMILHESQEWQEATAALDRAIECWAALCERTPLATPSAALRQALRTLPSLTRMPVSVLCPMLIYVSKSCIVSCSYMNRTLTHVTHAS